MRFDCNQIADLMSEVAAYGTAVTIRRIEPALPAAPPDVNGRRSHRIPRDSWVHGHVNLTEEIPNPAVAQMSGG